MTVDTANYIPEQNTSTQVFDWQNCWYPITFVKDLLFNKKPYSFSLYDEPLILFRNTEGKLVCLKDLCPHRAAKLSDGQIIDGKVECLYHGWQFGEEGECLHIPQLADKATIPKQACVKSFDVVESQGIVWVWLGSQQNNSALIPDVAEVEKPKLFVVDTVTDLPYDQNFLVENFLDPAHVAISHDRTELGMKREFASPLEMEILSSSVNGFTSRYRRTSGAWASTEFIAPGLVKYQFNNEAAGIVGGFALYAVPLGQGQCRVLVRRYGNFFNRLFKFKPRWLEHLRQNKLLEEDLPFIVEQQAYIEQTGKSLKEVYLPLKTSDVFVIEHRKWLDKFGENLPSYQGYVTAKQTVNQRLEAMPFDRFSRHTQICSSCYHAYQRINVLKQALIAAAIILAGLGILAENSTIKIIIVFTSIFAVAMAAGAQKLKTHFEYTYQKHHI